MKNLQINYGKTSDHRQQILAFVIGEKSRNPNFKVVDIGGSADSWSSTSCDLLIDINCIDSSTSLQIDICDPEAWTKVKEWVENNGKFDFAICTHTLEDIYDPIIVLKNLPIIAKRGVITTPSIKAELSNPENKNWLGYIHHRWIFDQLDEKMFIIPKIGLLEIMCKGRNFEDSSCQEIMYVWEENIPYSIFMNNYLGPNAATVIHAYNELINGIKNTYD